MDKKNICRIQGKIWHSKQTQREAWISEYIFQETDGDSWIYTWAYHEVSEATDGRIKRTGNSSQFELGQFCIYGQSECISRYWAKYLIYIQELLAAAGISVADDVLQLLEDAVGIVWDFFTCRSTANNALGEAIDLLRVNNNFLCSY